MISFLRNLTECFLTVGAFQLAAALSYYTLLSLAPLLLVLTGLFGLLLEESTIRNAFLDQTQQLVGGEGAAILDTVARNLASKDSNFLSMTVGSALTLFGATTVFAQLQAALNRIWQVEPDPDKPVIGFLRARLLALGIVLGLGFLLIVSLVLNAVLTGLSEMLAGVSSTLEVFWRVVNTLLTFALTSATLMVLLRFVPDARVPWREAAIGAVVTAALLGIGKFAIGLYLGQASVGSAYGAAGSAVVFMIWIYFSSLLLFLGTCVSRVLATRIGKEIKPNDYARLIPGAQENSRK